MDAEQKVFTLFGLIGYPVKHSYSAVMHNVAFAHYGMSARYELFEVPPDGLETFFKSIVKERRIQGFNVTVPHKETVTRFLTGQIAPMAEMVGAVNTIRVETDGRFSGFNTDEPGFGLDLEERGLDVSGKKAVLLGAGGAAKAVALALAALHVEAIEVFDIVREKAAGLAERVKRFYPTLDVRVTEEARLLRLNEAGLFVNATPLGMKDGDPLPVDAARLHADLFVYDLIYNPGQTPLLKAAEAAGCRWANGLGMLLHQGCLAFEYWTGRGAPIDLMRQALEKHVYG